MMRATTHKENVMSKMFGIVLAVIAIFASTAVFAQPKISSRYLYANAPYGSPNYVTSRGTYPFDRQLSGRF
jgi:hypothetical protein